ncbi:hypothetical protein Tneu_0675 [Pyrobaculum neutrophilum V24Sta]|uniref:Uncharacterized protein n=1 Tax=Pyrobaculum neutrophilum (strain DSM 2338 / JCM 9278 / NBRC 100436 / V24Sta) TaxID=444157 RepID=B1YCV1_PYRNV|nr:hypothetical protein Tneu_0675 [Pyrobaculum neutrophilum V24Sta]
MRLLYHLLLTILAVATLYIAVLAFHQVATLREVFWP